MYKLTLTMKISVCLFQFAILQFIIEGSRTRDIFLESIRLFRQEIKEERIMRGIKSRTVKEGMMVVMVEENSSQGER